MAEPGFGTMVRRLELVGIVLIAAGLLVLAFSDPLIRVLIFGPAGFTRVAGSGGSQFFISSSGGASAAGSASTVPRTTVTGGGTDAIASLLGFAASVVGLILTVTSILTSGKSQAKTASGT